MKRIISRVVLMTTVMILITLLAGCGNKKGLVGSWEYNSYTYNFNSDKTGNYELFGSKMEFTYEDDGKELSIFFEGDTVPMILPYRIEDNKLIITDSFDNEVTYTRK